MTHEPTYRQLLAATNEPDAARRAQALDAVSTPEVAATIKEVFDRLFRAFPDLHVSNDDLLEDGDKVVARQTVAGTNLGELMGRPPTGKAVTYGEIFIFRVADGRVTELWGAVDMLSCLQQLGFIPPLT